MGTEAAQALLGALGYEVRFREDAWVECLLLRPGEAWLGRAASREDALEAALAQACPSALAQALLHERLEVGPAALPPAPASEPESTAESEAEAQPEAPEPPRARPAAPRTAAPSNEPGRSPGLGFAVARAAISGPPPLVRKETSPPRIDPQRSLDELDVLLDRVRDSREELGLCAPDRQRLAILAWICEARAHTDIFPEDQRIRDKVGVISRQLTEIGKTFWPGSVTALQLQMQPRDLPRHILGGSATSWTRAAELAERALRSVEYADERRGFDPYGWADAQMTKPAPAAPEPLLDRLVADLEQHGSLFSGQLPRDFDPRPDPESFKRWVRELRWLRLANVDPDRWARAAGRLRWWSVNREAGLGVASKELDAAYCPERPWAEAVAAPSDLSANGAGGLHLNGASIEELQSALSGKRVVFVSTRRDPDLQTQLMQALPAASLDWRVAEPKRLEALGEAIQQGAYDVVLGAVGFQSQGTDHLLARACRQAGVRYVRVSRGHASACLRALARDLHQSVET